MISHFQSKFELIQLNIFLGALLPEYSMLPEMYRGLEKTIKQTFNPMRNYIINRN